ncbi:MAG: calcium/sodium antiporter [Candidatus Coprenecus sp.]
MNLLLLISGLALIVLGANCLVDGASGIARRAGVSEFVIGLTIVGFGTSCPELVVSLTGAISGNSDIAVGNVIGSNIFNTLFILGLTALLYPVSVTNLNRKRDIPITLIVTLLLLLFGMGSSALSRMVGSLFVVLFALYVYIVFRPSAKGESVDKEEKRVRNRPIYLTVVMVLAGLAGLIFGGELFVDSATRLARELGVSDKFIAITILAGGTSLPELATSIVAAVKGRGQLALGNILGSNVFNILLILGVSALVTPLSFGLVTIVDAIVLAVSAILPWVWSYSGGKFKIDRIEGAVMIAILVVYYIYLFVKL